MLETIRSQFDSGDFEGVVESIGFNNIHVETINSDDSAEFFGIAAISYFNFRDYKSALAYSEKLLEFIRSRKEEAATKHLYEQLIAISIESAFKTEMHIKCLSLVRKYSNNYEFASPRLSEKVLVIKENLSEKIVRFLFVVLSVFSFGLIILHNFFDLFSILVYYPIVVVLLLLFILYFTKRSILVNIVKSWI